MVWDPVRNEGAFLILWKRIIFMLYVYKKHILLAAMLKCGKKEWGGEFYFTPGNCHSNGLITLINSKCNVDKAASVILQDRILAVSLSLEGQDVTIFNVYGPNADKDKLNFIKELQKHIEEVPSSHKLVVSGDFNMVLSNQLDIISGCPHDSKIYQCSMIYYAKPICMIYGEFTTLHVRNSLGQVHTHHGRQDALTIFLLTLASLTM